MINSCALSFGGRRKAPPHHRTMVEMVREPTSARKAVLNVPEAMGVSGGCGCIPSLFSNYRASYQHNILWSQVPLYQYLVSKSPPNFRTALRLARPAHVARGSRGS